MRGAIFVGVQIGSSAPVGRTGWCVDESLAHVCSPEDARLYRLPLYANDKDERLGADCSLGSSWKSAVICFSANLGTDDSRCPRQYVQPQQWKLSLGFKAVDLFRCHRSVLVLVFQGRCSAACTPLCSHIQGLPKLNLPGIPRVRLAACLLACVFSVNKHKLSTYL